MKREEAHCDVVKI
ncbi:hypothetical protein MNO10_13190 [Rahnella aceris]|nr:MULTISPECIES: hypothetical protein [Rahnella]UHM92858.1 hypothetical protein J9880_11285 [Rahnella victoriana]UNK55396.1 hypothetical protein MNO10_13190 [Rahnella aceris]